MIFLKNKKLYVILLISTWVFGSVTLFQNCNPSTDSEQNVSDSTHIALHYTGSASCKSCHSTEHNEWLQSHHYLAMLPANDSTVLGDFNNAVLKADGVTSTFFMKNGKYYINTEDENGDNKDFEVKYTFGYTPLQQYLVEFPGGRMQVPRVSWDTEKKQWFHQYAGTKIPAHDWLHWTGNSQNWNTMCASCHSTNLQKNYVLESDTYATTFSEVNVSCESCHGPGSAHINYINSDDYTSKPKVANSFLHLGGMHDQMSVINNCAVCHSRKTDITGSLFASSEIMDDFIPQIPTTEFFHADGLMDGEVYNHTSFLQSKMFRNGVMCTDCHNPHSGKLLESGNLVCGKCHEPQKYDVTEHTFHAANTVAAECKSCHMYSQTYMGNDPRHDHSFRVPRPDLTVKYGTPNTCNSCHSDKSAKWAADAVIKWYGPERDYHFAEDLIPGSRIDDKSFVHLQKLLNDTAVPAVVKATSVHYLESLVAPNSLREILNALNDTNAIVRYHALNSLDEFPVETWASKAAPLLTDRVKAVRIAAANVLATVPAQMIPSAYINNLKPALSELEEYSLNQTDFSVGNITAADYYMKVNNHSRAEFFYNRGLQKDSLMNYARLNLSVALSVQGKNDEAVQVLNDALKLDPENDRIYFNKALLFAEQNKTGEALDALERAVQLNSTNTRVYYNYGLLLQQKGDTTKAEQVFKKGLMVAPLDGDLNYVLALLYLNKGESIKSREPLTVLLQYHRENPAYSQLLQRFQQLNK